MRKTVGELEDELKRKDERIAELRDELDELRELVQRLREHAEDYYQNIELWCETFDMKMTDEGGWTWQPFWDEWKERTDSPVSGISMCPSSTVSPAMSADHWRPAKHNAPKS